VTPTPPPPSFLWKSDEKEKKKVRGLFGRELHWRGGGHGVRRCRDSSRVAIRRTRRPSEHPPPSKVPRMSTGDSVPAGTKASGGTLPGRMTQDFSPPSGRNSPPRNQASAARAARRSIRRLSREGQPYLPPRSMGSIRLIIKEKNKVSEGGAGRREGGGGHRRWRCRVSSPSRFVAISGGRDSSRES